MSIVLGYIFAAINMLVVILMTTDNVKIYIDFHSFLCVGMGTALSAVIAFGPSSMKHLFVILMKAIRQKQIMTEAVITEIVKISKETKGEINQNFVAGYKTEFPFLKDGLGLISDGFSKEQIETVMQERLDVLHDRYKEDERTVKALTKIPPSFGLMGTTIGLVALFAQVGGADALKKIGPAMAVALTATLYGIILAFLVLNPLVERVVDMSHKDLAQRSVIMKGVLLLKQKVSPVYLEELLKSHLDFKKQGEQKTARAA